MIFPLKELNKHIQSFDHRNSLISIWGDFGVGKTTLALQTALLNCKASNLVIFIYTKPNLPLKLLTRISHKYNEKNMDNFLLYKILDFSDLFDFVLNFEHLIAQMYKNRKKVKIIILIDSLTNLYQIELRKNSKNKNVILNYKLSHILATLNYLKLNHPIELLIVNSLRRLKQTSQTIELQTGGRVMNYWIEYSIKIERDKKINYRILILKNHPETNEIRILSKLTKFGFE